MLTRVESFLDWLDVQGPDRTEAQPLIAQTTEQANGMMHVRDYAALAAVLLHGRPRRIFEIGTYLGVTADFFLQLLPECEVLSIAYANRSWNPFSKRYNNSELSRKKVGSRVGKERVSRFRQLYGDSHELEAGRVVSEFGVFDLVFIDGDHSGDGVRQDTELAANIINDSGIICWHDANPKHAYQQVRVYLEDELAKEAIATSDDYIGGIACWSQEIESRLKSARARGHADKQAVA